MRKKPTSTACHLQDGRIGPRHKTARAECSDMPGTAASQHGQHSGEQLQEKPVQGGVIGCSVDLSANLLHTECNSIAWDVTGIQSHYIGNQSLSHSWLPSTCIACVFTAMCLHARQQQQQGKHIPDHDVSSVTTVPLL